MKEPFLSAWWGIFKILGIPFFPIRYRSHYQGPKPKEPFVMIANHARDIDPVLISSYFAHPAHWLSAQEAFINRLRGLLLTSMGAFQIKRYDTDLYVVRRVIEAVQSGKSIALFPYGNASWDGVFRGSLPGTESLIRYLKIPVLAIRVEGLYLSFPRWARKKRTGEIRLKAGLFEPGKAIEHITFSEWDWQKERKQKYVGDDRALGLDRILWFCPQCSTFRSIECSGNYASCPVCHSRLYVDEYGYANDLSIDVLLEKQIETLAAFMKENADFSIGPGKVFIRKKDQTRIIMRYETNFLVKDRILFAEPVPNTLTYTTKEIPNISGIFPFEELKYAVGFQKTMLEFVYRDYVIRLYSDNASLLLLKTIELKKGEFHVLEHD
jgi:1-acyl-sn-glycerol-3-phosphate acyltransferase